MSDQTYYRLRAEAERRLAASSATAEGRAVHEALRSAYLERARENGPDAAPVA